eukprot:11690561-Ditylum_brightwellii.AAC.1
MSTILQQIKSSTDKLLHIVRDVSEQTKAMNTDKTSVFTTTTQGASIESLSESDEMFAFQPEDNNNLLTQEEEEITKHKKPGDKSNNKNNQFPKKLSLGKIYCCKIDNLHKSMGIPKK